MRPPGVRGAWGSRRTPPFAPDAGGRCTSGRDWLTRLRRDAAPSAPRRAALVHERAGRDRFVAQAALGTAPEHAWIALTALDGSDREAHAVEVLRDALRG